MNCRSRLRPPSPSKATAASPPAISATSPAQPRQSLDRHKRCVDPDFRRQRPASRSTSIFAAPSTTFWRDCRRTFAAHRPRKAQRRAAPRGPGRPKLGVVAREVTLLPRHWDWLAQQTGGASVAIRKLVEEARRGGEESDRIRARRRKRPIASCPPWPAIAPHYEDAIRALFADDPARFEKLIARWPADVRDHVSGSQNGAFQPKPRPRSRLIPQT